MLAVIWQKKSSGKTAYGSRKGIKKAISTEIACLWSIADSNRSPRHCQCRALAR